MVGQEIVTAGGAPGIAGGLVWGELPVELIHLEEDAAGRRALVELDDGTRLLVRPDSLRAAGCRATEPAVGASAGVSPRRA
jgi:hypothetical protein